MIFTTAYLQSPSMLSAAEFLKHYENVNPLPSNLVLYDAWAQDAKELWEVQIGEDDSPLEAALEFRFDMLTAAVCPAPSSSEAEAVTPLRVIDDSWKWLLSATQVEQRTDAWYAETKNIVTASEISGLWKSPRTRGMLVMSKVGEPQPVNTKRNSAFRRSETGPMDWGVRYEPVVKQILEDTMGAKIQDLGRIRHRKMNTIAASPDGLIVECSKFPELVGSLVEIKCPPTRVINDKIPFDYWCQMQLQMEVCERPSCEFVEVKFKELEEGQKPTEGSINGWITLEGNSDTMELRYSYGESVPEGSWVIVEKYQWEVAQMRRVTLAKDQVWFESIQPQLEQFWKDVEAARSGLWTLPPSTRQKKEAPASSNKCAIVDIPSDSEPVHPTLSFSGDVETAPVASPSPTADTSPENVKTQE